MSNKYRGEVTITLGGEQVTLRPSLQALCDIEDVLKKSIITLLAEFGGMGLSFKEQVAIIEFSQLRTLKLSHTEISELLYEQGLLTNLSSLCQFLKYAIGLE